MKLAFRRGLDSQVVRVWPMYEAEDSETVQKVLISHVDSLSTGLDKAKKVV